MIDSISTVIQHSASLGAVVPGGHQELGAAPPTTQGQQALNGTTSHPSPAPQQEPASMWLTFLPLIAVFVGVWCLMILPQRRREKKMKELQSNIKAGDNVVTNSGMFGRVADVGTDCFVVEMGISGRTVKIPILKSDVLGVRDPVLTPPPKEAAES